ncbi:hypothetical protein JQ616_00880 [Bradyrhizobium tropiciagri]|uniref:hypothetical protein n=1 Tax=Bradyrhizobium tropiciagri TaxID=312253 RepID=UPI001BAD7EA5|nr:hypothetical protein [Bradyrhizobium tropiciagri]MBR0893485.1 hypothetical protein [Bradyrhizobium tropiciagri]
MGRPNAFHGMMHEFCVELGWCGWVKDGKPLRVSDFIPEIGPITARDFAGWLITADGLDPDQLNVSELRLLEAVFIKHMGASIVDANELRSADRDV